MVATLFFFTSLAFLIVCMRLFTRIVLVRNVGVDDCLMVVAMVSRQLEKGAAQLLGMLRFLYLLRDDG